MIRSGETPSQLPDELANEIDFIVQQAAIGSLAAFERLAEEMSSLNAKAKGGIHMGVGFLGKAADVLSRASWYNRDGQFSSCLDPQYDLQNDPEESLLERFPTAKG